MGESKCFLSMHKLLETAISDYQMIDPGDHVLVGLSGGKDSSMLLRLLARKKIQTTNEFKLSAVFVKMGFKNDDEISDYLRKFCDDLGVKYFEIEKSLEKVLSAEKKQPCYLCSRTRRLALFDLADEIGANVIAFGFDGTFFDVEHRSDDAVLPFEKRIYGFHRLKRAVEKEVHQKCLHEVVAVVSESDHIRSDLVGEIEKGESSCP